MLCTNTNAWTYTHICMCESTYPSTQQRNKRCLLFFLLLNFLYFCTNSISILRDLVEKTLPVFITKFHSFPWPYSMATKVWKNNCQPAFHCKDVVLSWGSFHCLQQSTDPLQGRAFIMQHTVQGQDGLQNTGSIVEIILVLLHRFWSSYLKEFWHRKKTGFRFRSGRNFLNSVTPSFRKKDSGTCSESPVSCLVHQ